MNLSYFKYYDSKGRLGFTEDMIEKKDEIYKILNKNSRKRFTSFIKFIKFKKENLDDFSNVIYFLNSNKVIITCKKHGDYKISPNSYMSNHRCSLCGNNQLTETEFLYLINKKFQHLIILNKFIDLSHKINVKCILCNSIKEVRADKLLNSKFGCRCIAGNKKPTTEEYKQKLSKNIICLENYIDNSTPILHKCKFCGYEWNVSPQYSLKIDCCPKCSLKRESDKRKIPLKKINENLKKTERPLICLEYTSRHKKSHFKCLKCNHDWWARSDSVISYNTGCPNCHSSSYEILISEWLKNHNIEFIREYTFKNCRNKNLLPFDFYIPKYNMLIEMQGIQHFKPVKFRKSMSDKECLNNFIIRQKLDSIKKDFALNNNFIFITISYKENINDTLNSIFKNYSLF